MKRITCNIKFLSYKLQVTSYKSNGSAILIALLFMAVTSTTILGVGKIALAEIRNSVSADETVSAFFAAETGLEEAMVNLRANPSFNTDSEPGGILKRNLSRSAATTFSPQDKYYELKATNLGQNNTVESTVFRDETKEFDVTGKLPLTLQWDRKEGELIPDNKAQCRTRGTASNFVDEDGFRNLLEWRLFDEDATFPAAQLIKTGLNNLTYRTTNYDAVISASSADISATNIPAGHRIKLRFRLFVVRPGFKNYTSISADTSPDQNLECQIDFRLTGTPGSQIDRGITTVASTGYYGRTKRTLEAKINNATRRVLSIFDYSIFVGEGELK